MEDKVLEMYYESDSYLTEIAAHFKLTVEEVTKIITDYEAQCDDEPVVSEQQEWQDFDPDC